MSAVISECGKYRYVLTREARYGSIPCSRLMYLGLNPSTADGRTDDATVRRWRGFSISFGFGGAFMAANLYAYRATDPAELRCVADPVGPENNGTLLQMAAEASIIVLCYGANPIAQPRAAIVLELLEDYASKFRALEYSAGGAPCHPLRLPGSAQLQPYPRVLERP